MDGLIRTCTITTSVLLVVMLVYFPIIWLNLVFTFAQLPLTSVPFYYVCSDSNNQGVSCNIVDFFFSPNRWYPTWWMFAIDITLIIPLITPLLIIIKILRSNTPVNIWLPYTLPTAFAAVLQVAKLILYFPFSFIFCEAVQVCRNYNSADPSVNPNIPNWVFITAASFTLFFSIYLIVYAFYAENIMTAQKIYFKKSKKS